MPKNSALSGSKNKGKGNALGLALAKNIKGIPMHLQAKNPAAYLVSWAGPPSVERNLSIFNSIATLHAILCALHTSLVPPWHISLLHTYSRILVCFSSPHAETRG